MHLGYASHASLNKTFGILGGEKKKATCNDAKRIMKKIYTLNSRDWIIELFGKLL